MTSSASRNMKIDILLMPCIYFIHCVRGALGSFFLRYKYSWICLQTPMVSFFVIVKLTQSFYSWYLLHILHTGTVGTSAAAAQQRSNIDCPSRSDEFGLTGSRHRSDGDRQTVIPLSAPDYHESSTYFISVIRNAIYVFKRILTFLSSLSNKR